MATTTKCKKCGCEDSFLISPAPCPTPEGCPDPEPCSEVFDAQCVKYTGDDILCLQNTLVSTNDSVADALVNIVEYFCDSTTIQANILCGETIIVNQNNNVQTALENIVDYFCESDSYISDVELQGTNLVFTGVNLAFDGTINLSGIGAGVTANNGLTMFTPTNVRLGGLLVQNTTITTSNGTLPQDFNFKITGARASNTDSILLVENTGLGTAIFATSTSNTAVSGFSPGQAGGYFTSQTNTAAFATTMTFNVPALITGNNASLSNGKPTGLRLDTQVTLGLPTNGVGNKIVYNLSHVNGSGFNEIVPSNEILSTFTDVLSASLTSHLIFRGRANGAIVLSDLVNFKGDGEVQFYEYGVGNFVSTPTYMLGVDALGNIVEVAL